MNRNKPEDIHRAFAEIPDKNQGSAYRRILRSNEEPGRKLLHDPIAFALEFAPDETRHLEEVFGAPADATEETLDAWWTVLEIIATRESSPQMLDALGQFSDFVTGYWLEGKRYGIALGSVLEQYRMGLLGVLEIIDRDFDSSDGFYIESLAKLCKRHGIDSDEGHLHDQKELIAAD